MYQFPNDFFLSYQVPQFKYHSTHTSEGRILPQSITNTNKFPTKESKEYINTKPTHTQWTHTPQFRTQLFQCPLQCTQDTQATTTHTTHNTSKEFHSTTINNLVKSNRSLNNKQSMSGRIFILGRSQICAILYSDTDRNSWKQRKFLMDLDIYARFDNVFFWIFWNSFL